MNPRSAAQPSSYSFGVTQTGSHQAFSGGVHVGIALGDVNGDTDFAAPRPNQVLIALLLP